MSFDPQPNAEATLDASTPAPSMRCAPVDHRLGTRSAFTILDDDVFVVPADAILPLIAQDAGHAGGAGALDAVSSTLDTGQPCRAPRRVRFDGDDPDARMASVDATASADGCPWRCRRTSLPHAPLGSPAVIEAKGLTKRYGQVLAVDDLTFTVPPGRVTGFLGPNGSGKSTTMRLLLQLDRPNGGAATFKGQSYRSFKHPATQVGALLDAAYAHPSRNACNHLWAVAAASKLPRTRVDEALAMVGLTEVAKRPVGGFSLGHAPATRPGHGTAR